MSWIDVGLGAIILVFVIRGVLRGLIREGAGLAGILIGLVLGVNRYEELGKVIHTEFNSLPLKICNIASFIIIFGGVSILGAIAGIVLHDIFSRNSVARGLEEGGGFMLGLLEGAIVCSIILILLNLSPFSTKVNRWSENSLLKPYLLKVGPFVYDSIVSLTPGKAKNFMEKLDPLKLKNSLPGASK